MKRLFHLKIVFFGLLILFSIENISGQSIYASTTIEIIQLSPHTFQHISYLQTNDFGKVACNGLIVIQNKEAVILDTPTDLPSSEELLHILEDSLKYKIVGVLASHFHNDCLGGMAIFHRRNIPSYGSEKTIELAQLNQYLAPKHSFKKALTLKAGEIKVKIRFLGEGHTKDNVVAYVPSDQVLFGGCLVKEMNASKGYLGDANLRLWSPTMDKVKKTYPKARIIVPGHGKPGDSSLLEYTRTLFGEEN